MGTIVELLDRKSVRVFTDQSIANEVKESIIQCAINAPTAGNQMLYTILDIEEQLIKDELAVLCDHQPFIADAPWTLLFLADCRRWQDAYDLLGCESRDPGLGDLILACEDAMIAAQNAVVAAQAHGLGSCYIGDIIENREQIVELLDLDPWVFPITLLIFGHPTEQQLKRPKPPRFDPQFIVLKDRYRRLSPEELQQMFKNRGDDFASFVSSFCQRKYLSDFALEMNRSVAAYLKAFQG